MERVVLEVIAEKTGYDVDMVEQDASLEDDLGIDSIKRIELLSAIQNILGVEGDREALARTQTVGDVIECLRAQAGTASAAPAANGDGEAVVAAASAGPVEYFGTGNGYCAFPSVDVADGTGIRAALLAFDTAFVPKAPHTKGVGVSSNTSYVPALAPTQLGHPGFLQAYGVTHALYTGAMAKGIASADLVIATGRAGLLGSFGAGGLSLDVVEKALDRIQSALDPEGALCCVALRRVVLCYPVLCCLALCCRCWETRVRMW